MERQVSRSPSMRSTTSATSQGTVASTASGPSTKRITPLWNLNHHTVMTTYVSDAGTDAKLVKFLKRGIAVHRLGFLEPYEHWPSVISSPSSTNPSPSSKFIPLPTEINLGRPSLDQVFSRQSILSAASSEATAVNGEDQTGPKKLFGRFFGSKKKETGGGGGSTSDFSSFFKPSGSVGSLFASKENVQPPPHSPSGASAASVTPTASPSKSFAALGVPGSPSPSTNSVAAPSVNVAQFDSIHGPLPYLGYPTLGTQPIVRPLPANEKSPGSRPAAYIWVVTKWTAGEDGWTFAGLSDALSIGSGAQSQTATTTVRFEWIRGRTGKRPSNPRRASGAGSPVPGSAPKSNGALQPTVGNVLPPSSLGPGLSTSSPNLSRTSLALSNTGASENNLRMSFDSRNGGATETEPSSLETDAEEEVLPEDSEIPWMCYVVRSNPQGGPSERSLIGTLSPAPHHPKVLAQLKTPFPLNPFPLPGLKEMPVLSPDQLKDVLCATAMFLLIREEWGGIGKKKKDASSAGKR
ncbi:hypothetical protein BDY24DRAFT_395827 [Mrakia frigida]|uniref:uncharacterized protein n=1 Tax=Mrakia frigida TaxID=29902 RepID=UPI003FCBF396